MEHVPGSGPPGTLRPVRFERPESPHSPALPRPLTSFVGREDDIAVVMALLARDDVRLLTLTGPGGVGKSRLAIRIATEISGQYPDGAIWVPLVQIRDAALIGPAISRAVQASHPSRLDADPVSLLRNVRGLLVLDNFEHVMDAVSLIGSLLLECPGLTILITSRQALELTGEHRYTVPPFAVADGDDPSLRDDAFAPEAVRLFVERARARDASFTLTAETAEAITAICSALDGLPLAIELAAAQIPMFTPASLLSRLEERLSILTHGPVDTHDRHRTMRGAIGWSYDLLDAPLQTAFRQLAVFVGGFTLESAEAVIGSPGETLEIVSGLLARCLIIARPFEDGTTRYWMLETIREFGLERLEESGDEHTTRDRHATWMQTVADRCEMSWFLPMEEGERHMAELEREQSNARAALQWLDQRGDAEATLRLAGNLGGLWFIRGFMQEGCRWLDPARAPETSITASTRAKALLTRAWIAVEQKDRELAIHLSQESRRYFSPQERPDITIGALAFESLAASAQGDHVHAQQCLHTSVQLLDALAPTPSVYNQRTTHSVVLGKVAMIRGDIDEAEKMFGEAVDRQRSVGQKVGHGFVYGGQILSHLGDMARARGDHRAAIGLYREHLALAWRFRISRIICYDLGAIGAAMACLGDTDTAARLLGASERAHASFGVPFDQETLNHQRALGLPEPWAREDEPCPPADAMRAAVRARRPLNLPPIGNLAEAQASWEAGRQVSLADAVDEAVSVDIGAFPTEPDHGLTARELEVLRLLVDGKPETEIADELYISQRTVATHVRHIYDKLDISSRAEAGAWAVRNGIA